MPQYLRNFSPRADALGLLAKYAGSLHPAARCARVLRRARALELLQHLRVHELDKKNYRVWATLYLVLAGDVLPALKKTRNGRRSGRTARARRHPRRRYRKRWGSCRAARCPEKGGKEARQPGLESGGCAPGTGACGPTRRAPVLAGPSFSRERVWHAHQSSVMRGMDRCPPRSPAVRRPTHVQHF